MSIERELRNIWDQLRGSKSGTSTAKPGEVVKYVFAGICTFLDRSVAEVLRSIARRESAIAQSGFREFVEQVEDAIRNWRVR